MTDEPLFDKVELAAMFAPLEMQASVALAVSGGSDSMALLLLADSWRRERLARRQIVPDFSVYTVDHGLRPAAADECALVEARAAALGYPVRRLLWRGDRPKSRVQETAREIRYQLLATACQAGGVPLLMTGHHLDDQVETFLMRLARGSGVDGLATMAPEIRRYGLSLYRPLLEVPKQRLRAALEEAGWPYVEDPSNADPRYERARLRGVERELTRLGLKPAMIGRSITRLRRARAALESLRDDFIAENAFVSPFGSARLDQLAFGDLPDELALRVLAKLLRVCGGRREALPVSRLETLVTRLQTDFATNRTLAGCRLIAKGDDWLIVREAGRIRELAKPVAPGDCVFWDNRYVICATAEVSPKIIAGPLGPHAGPALVELADGLPHKPLPGEAMASLLAFRRGERLIGVPALDLWADETLATALSVKFIAGDEGLF